MNEITLAILAILAVLNGVLVFLLVRKPAMKPDIDSKLVLQQLNEVTRQLSDTSKHASEVARSQTSDIQRSINHINDQVSRQLLEVVKGVSETNEASKQVFTIAEQLHNLEKVLKHQKQRGTLGEASLDLILSNILPPTGYKTQHQFKDGNVVDAAIITRDGIIPVDAKFSLDNYSRIINETDDAQKALHEDAFKKDLKKRIDETSKYIRTDEGTLPFAFMFIPAEGIYYDLLVNEIGGNSRVNARSLIDYAYNDKKVVIVSPTTFAAYLQSVLYGFKAYKIEESAQEIRKYVGELTKHLKAYEDYHQKLGNQLGTVVNHYNSSNKEFRKIDKDILKITGEKAGIEQLTIAKPSEEE